VIETTVEQTAESVECFRCAGGRCPKCGGSGRRPAKRCAACGGAGGVIIGRKGEPMRHMACRETIGAEALLALLAP
jgi:hypothetical protein